MFVYIDQYQFFIPNIALCLKLS